MNVYRVQYYLITGRSIESMRGQEFKQRYGIEKTAFVLAATPEAAGAHIAAQHDCEILSAITHLANVEVADTPPGEAAPQPVPAPVVHESEQTDATH